jgi:asparagine synthase (glutamine-hydrolysing)
MCGLSGCFFVNKNDVSNNFLFEANKFLSREIIHRGPDDNSFWSDEKENIYFAHNRLKIIDLTLSGNQPMVSYTNNLIIIYNGEIYNHSLIKEKLIIDSNNKIKFNSRCDTEILINAIDLWGIKKTLNEIKGMFSFALWNKKQKKLTLCRDRFGEKPLYYYTYKNGIFFSSEIKSFKSLINVNNISKKNFDFFLQYGFNLDNNTIYEKVEKVPPGTYIEFENKDQFKLKKNTFNYWNSTNIAQKSLKKLNTNKIEEICIQTEELLENIIKDQLIADVKTGVFLSGGVDSSLVTAIAQKLSNQKISTFSIGFDVKDYDESKSAQAVSQKLNTNHKEYTMTSNDLVEIIKKKCLLDEPFYDVSQYPTYLLSKFAAKEVKVCLSGDGADEVFGGYNRYLIGHKNFLNIKKITNFFKLKNFLTKQMDSRFIGLLLKKSGLAQVENKKDKLKALIQSDNEKDLYERLLRVENINYAKNLINYKKISNMTDNFMINDTENYLPNDILYKVDSLSMLNSLETRTPYLDDKLFEFAWSIPQEYKFYKNNSKFILKKILSKFIGQQIINKPKMGFDIPLFTWMNESKKLQEIIKDFYFLKNDLTDQFLPNIKLEKFEINKKNFTNIWKIALMKKWIIENN